MDAREVSASVLPAPFRTFTRAVGGAEFAAVLGLALHLAGVPVVGALKWLAPATWLSPDWIPSESESVAFVAAVVFVAALVGVLYVVGLVVDYWATEAWSWIGRTDGEGDDDERGGKEETARASRGRTKLKEWHAIRTRHGLIEEAVIYLRGGFRPSDLDELRPWLHAQRWWWESDNAMSQFADLQMRLSIAKVTAFNAAAVAVVSLVGLWWNGLVFWPTAATLGVAAGGLWIVLTNPVRPENDTEDNNRKDQPNEAVTENDPDDGSAQWWKPWSVSLYDASAGAEAVPLPWPVAGPWTSRPVWLTGASLAAVTGFAYVAWILVCPVVDLAHLREPGALSLTAVVGTYLAFGFLHVRMHTNGLYHRTVRDAACLEAIKGRRRHEQRP